VNRTGDDLSPAYMIMAAATISFRHLDWGFPPPPFGHLARQMQGYRL
jgi:hypothetical protein